MCESWNQQLTENRAQEIVQLRPWPPCLLNTLAASDYGLLDQNTFEPRPNYWATLLWRNLMGTTVLDPQVSAAPNTYVYAQCLKGQRGGVTLLIINADRQRSFDLNLPTASERYTLTAKKTRKHHS